MISEPNRPAEAQAIATVDPTQAHRVAEDTLLTANEAQTAGLEDTSIQPEAKETTMNELDQLHQELEAMRRQAEENLDKALRAQAEMENLRKRSYRDLENAYKYALEKFVRELLPVLDSLELGISVSQDDTDNIEGLREGMSLTLQKFSDTLQKFGVSVVDPVAEKFNPERHEAVTMQAVEGTDPGMVTAVMQKGYELNGRLVRPAMVVVAR